jgi:predicted nucleic acid-binding protein
MIFDKIVDEPGMLDRVQKATAEGLLTLLTTSVSQRQIAATPDASRRALLESVPAQYLGTAGFVLDYSLLDVDRLGPAQPIEAIAKGKRKELEDALIVATAAADRLPLVTADTRFRNRVGRELPHVPVWAWERLRSELISLGCQGAGERA